MGAVLLADLRRDHAQNRRKPSSDRDGTARKELCELLRLFYGKGWISGTGGGICAKSSDGELLLAPSGVHKERVRPEDLFVVQVEDGTVVRPPKDTSLRPSECGPIFRMIIRERNASSVIHSHALSAVLAADLVSPEGSVKVRRFEMLKGIRGGSNRDAHDIPVIENTPEEPQLTDGAQEVLRDPRFSAAYCILVRDHGAYIWGDDMWEAKRHAEVYHFLFDGVVARTRRLEGE